MFAAAQLPPDLDAEALEVLARRGDAGDSAAAQVWGSHQQLRVCRPVLCTFNLHGKLWRLPAMVEAALEFRGMLQ